MTPARNTVGLPVLTEPEVPLYTGHMTGRLEQDLRIVSRNRMAEAITGGLSSPGKMPCLSWGISAARCRVGSVLAAQAGTVCHACYATKRNYARDSVQAKLEARYEGVFNDLWTPSMIFLVRYFCDRYFRLFNSSDIQGLHHLKNMVTMAQHFPDVKMWLPTRETATVRAVLREIGEFPENLIVRVSANQIDGEPPDGFAYTSAVATDPKSASCIAQRQHNRCDGEVGSCRACWEEAHVTYPLH